MSVACAADHLGGFLLLIRRWLFKPGPNSLEPEHSSQTPHRLTSFVRAPLMSAGDVCERCLRFTDHHDFMSERLNLLGDLMSTTAWLHGDQGRVGAMSARSS